MTYHIASKTFDRPPVIGMEKINSSNQHTINSASYGPTWRLLRRNLTAKILHPTNIRSYSHSRKWALQKLKIRLESESKDRGTVQVMSHLRYAIFCLIICLCFGEAIEEDHVKKIEEVHVQFLLNFVELSVLNFWESVAQLTDKTMIVDNTVNST